jgi:uncharacterized protein (DUF2384 family)
MGSPLEEANMSVLAHGKNTAAASSLAATAGFLRKTIRSGTRLLVHAIDAIAEARMHKAEPSFIATATGTRRRTTTTCRSSAEQTRRGDLP